MRFVKGHGTENDFVLLPDFDGALEVGPELVAALCDRRAGLGADGVLRVVRSKSAGDPAADALADRAEWFMDYRNADGSVAEMCGNGARVFARYLVDAGLAEPGEWNLATRGGLRRVALGRTGDVTIDMGVPEVQGSGATTVAGLPLTGVRVSVGNPHLACRVPDVAAVDLSRAPELDPADFPAGANVEFFASAGPGHITMRVFERGSGETRSCGTGTVAAAAAAALGSDAAAGAADGAAVPPGRWLVDVPGGRVTVELTAATSLLTGPAVLVAEGELRPGWPRL